MSLPKTIKTEVAIDWYAELISRVLPQMLEILHGGPAGPGGVKTVSAIVKAATPAQREQMTKGFDVIAKFCAEGKTAIKEAAI